jgi:hypothetical protein
MDANAELQFLVEHGAVSLAVAERIATLPAEELRQLTTTLRAEHEVREAERQEIERDRWQHEAEENGISQEEIQAWCRDWEQV